MDKRIEDGQKNRRWQKNKNVQIKKGTRSDPRSRAAIARAADFLAGGCKWRSQLGEQTKSWDMHIEQISYKSIPGSGCSYRLEKDAWYCKNHFEALLVCCSHLSWPNQLVVSVNLFNALSYPWKEQLILEYSLYQRYLMLKLFLFFCWCGYPWWYWYWIFLLVLVVLVMVGWPLVGPAILCNILRIIVTTPTQPQLNSKVGWVTWKWL